MVGAVGGRKKKEKFFCSFFFETAVKQSKKLF